MTKRIAVTTILLILILTNIRSQSTDLPQSITNISAQIKQVKTADAQIDQKIGLVKDNIVDFEVTRTDNKGKVSTQSFQFNLADINRASIKQQLDGQVMLVEMRVKGDNKFIEVSKDGKSDGYQNSLKITVYDADNAKLLISAVQNSAKIAETMELAKFSFASQDDILSNLYKAVKTTPDNVYTQTIKSTADKKTKLDFSSVKDGKTEKYEFELSDINPAKINIKISGFLGILPGKALSVSVETNNGQKVIKQFENDVPKTYVSSFSIYPTDIENAKQIKNLIYLAIQNLKSGATALSDFSYSANMSSANNSAGSAAKATENTTASNAAAQSFTNSISDADIPNPDFSLRPYYITNDKKLENLERADASTDMKLKGMGYGGHDLYYTAFAPQSLVKFKQGNLPKLVIKMDNNNQDPSEMVTLSKAEIKKDRRRFLLESASMTGAAHDVNSTKVSLQFRKIRDGLYEIILPANLGSGEYAFMPVGGSVSLLSASTIKISCFSVGN